ncbi:shikimate dehydrogenase [Cumulibacter manganitolerans]|uniref:shikimate dehydrogenase n=1 Tax=Cumulibacter manganitolerans TaxID=1884992 RepID=UPI0012954E3B|nr:shikimate dehydrogenase [Cumulibacter manganitolerans]
MTARRACAVIGSPIEHSRSPALHLAAYRQLGLDWTYTRREVAAGDLAAFVDAVSTGGLDGLPCGGLSVTMPGKAEALERAEVRDPRAEALGAANTLVPLYEGARITSWHAYNTDVDGIVGALADQGHAQAGDRHAVILGAGGTAAAALAALQSLGATRTDVVVRDPRRAATLAAVGDRLGCAIDLVPWSELASTVSGADLVLSTVPPGAADAAADARFHHGQVVLDAAYGGGASALLAAARAGGAVAIDGIWMLLHQAVEQVRLMTGRRPSVAAMRAALG